MEQSLMMQEKTYTAGSQSIDIAEAKCCAPQGIFSGTSFLTKRLLELLV
jgi:hypothetical protein